MPRFRPWQAAAAMACGHLASMGVAAGALAWRLPLDRAALQWGAGALLAGALACRWRKGHALAGQASMALWTFLASTVHGGGLALVPALMTICGSGAGGTLPQALAALGLHLAAMLAANGAVFYLAARLLRALRA
jgi:hypothetical protein